MLYEAVPAIRAPALPRTAGNTFMIDMPNTEVQAMEVILTHTSPEFRSPLATLAYRYRPRRRMSDRVMEILLQADLSRPRARNVAEQLGFSSTTLRRRLREDHTRYQLLLDQVRQYRCEQRMRRNPRIPGKCLAQELGYIEVNSFYRAFRRWTGENFGVFRDRRC